MYQGDYLAAATVVFNFNTASFSDGSPITLAGTPALSVYKNSTTESTTGITLTVDYDARTGMHHVVIDTSADGTFYAAGNDFDVIITAGTVGGTSVVGRKVGSFSLENRCQKADVRKLLGTAWLTPAVAGTPDVNAKQLGGVVPGSATIGTVTTLTNLPAIPANWLTAAGIAAAALNGKGDWLLASSYTAPDNADILLIKAKTDNLPASPAAVGSAMTLDLTQTVTQANVSADTTVTVGKAMLSARAQAAGAWTVSGTTLTLKNPDGTTFRTFTLDSSSAPTSRT